MRGLERRGVRDGRHVVRFLHRVRAEHREAGLAAGHDVGVVAEDRQRVRRQRARRDVHRERRQLARRSCTCWGSSAAGPATP